MTEETGPAEDLRWILEPAEPGSIHFHLDVGSGAELSEEAQAAIEEFLSKVHAEMEVSGFLYQAGCNPRVTTCARKVFCPSYSDPNCSLMTCTPLSCRIKAF